MAVFHYKLELLPAIAEDAYAKLLDHRRSEHSEADVWLQQPSTAALTRLRALLPLDHSWGPCEEYVSSIDTWNSDLRIWHLDDSRSYVKNIEFRFSSVKMPLDLLAEFVRLAEDENYMLGTADSARLMRPILECVIADFRNTRAARFLANPESTILEAACDVESNDVREN